ncbi:NfeD family protein [Jatrophihabitans fulvus]
MADPSLVGALGTVVRDIRGGRLPGEIRVVDGGEAVLLMAYCERPLAAGARVRVTGGRGPRQVDVRPWP